MGEEMVQVRCTECGTVTEYAADIPKGEREDCPICYGSDDLPEAGVPTEALETGEESDETD